jgi:hypothetical protein
MHGIYVQKIQTYEKWISHNLGCKICDDFSIETLALCILLVVLPYLVCVDY